MSTQPRTPAGRPDGGEFSSPEKDDAPTDILAVRRTLPTFRVQSLATTADHYLYVREKFELDAPYQRGSVWDTTRRQDLIQSLLIGIPIGAIVVNRRPIWSDKRAAVIDGKQRIQALRGMADGEFGIPAEWVDERFQGPLQPIDYRGRTVPGVLVTGEKHPFMAELGNFIIPTAEAHVTSVEEEARIFRLINTAGVDQTPETLAAAADVEAGR